MTGPNVPALVGQLRSADMSSDAISRVFATFNAAAPGFAEGTRDEPPK